MKRVFTGLVLIFMLAASGKVFGQQRASSYDQAVMEMLKVVRADQQMVTGAEGMADAMTSSNPMLLPFRDVIVDWAKKYLTWDAMLPEMIKAYKDTYTESEIRELIAFYKTPLGQKMLTSTPELAKKAMIIGAGIGQAHSDDLRQMIEARAKELQELSKKP